MDDAEPARTYSSVVGVPPGGARHRPEVPAVRTAEEHAEVHAGHVGLAAAVELRGGELGAAVGALFVRKYDGDPAQRPVVARANVVVAVGAVIRGPRRAASRRC